MDELINNKYDRFMPTKRPSRKVGRPRHTGDVNARERLLDAAVELLAKKGIAATSIADIATHAGVTPAMVHYYFTNRSALLDAIASERLMRTVSELWAPVAEQSADLELMVRGLVQRIVQSSEQTPWLPALWLRDIVSEGGQLRERMLKTLSPSNTRHFTLAVEGAQRRGEINPDLDPRLVIASLMGLTLVPLAAMSLLGDKPQAQGFSAKQIGKHAEALLLQGLSITPIDAGRSKAARSRRQR